MGCKLTKAMQGVPSSGEGDAYGGSGGLTEPPPPAPLDPRIPLTARQKFSMIKSWKAISRSLQPTGVYMFLTLFESQPELLLFFNKFQDLKSRDAQAESMELAEHAATVMNAIDEGINAMDNVDFFFDLLHQIGASHTKIKGFKKEFFWKIERPFLEAVRLTLGDRYTDNMDQIYRITIRFLIDTVVKGYEIAEGKEVNDNNLPKTEGEKKFAQMRSCPVSAPGLPPPDIKAAIDKNTANELDNKNDNS